MSTATLKPLLILVVSLFMSSDSAAQEIAEERSLNSAIDKAMRENGVPGAAIAVVNRNGPVWIAEFGLADLATRKPVTASTVFRTGSVGKSLVALAIMKLQEQGKLGLDTKVSDLAPELKVKNPWERTSPLRVVHLLEHSSGFDDMVLGEVRNRSEDPGIPLSEVFRRFPEPQRVRWEPGTRVAYSNPGYAVAGYLIEKVSGRRFEDYIQSEILNPLGMTESGYILSEKLKTNLATGYEGIPPRPLPYYATYMRPGGEFKASIADMALWLQMLLNRGETATGQICSRSSIARMEKGETSLAARMGLRSSFGAGIDSDDSKRILTLGHGGAIDGFVATYQYVPAQGIGYAVLLNADSGDALDAIENLVFDNFTQGLPAEQEPAVSVSIKELQNFEGYYSPDSPRAEVGKFAEELAGGLWVAVDDGALEVKDLFSPREKLIATGQRRFRRERQPEASFVFIPSRDGKMVLAGRGSFYKRMGQLWPMFRMIVLFLAAIFLLSAPVMLIVFGVGKLFGRFRALELIPLLIFTVATGSLITAGLAFTKVRTTLEPKGTAAQVMFLATSVVPLLSCLGFVTTLLAVRRSSMTFANYYLTALTLSACGVSIYLASWHMLPFRPWAY